MTMAEQGKTFCPLEKFGWHDDETRVPVFILKTKEELDIDSVRLSNGNGPPNTEI